MGAFFNSWALWEKMCFVLAVGILGVILLGCAKVVYNHWRLRKYTKLAAVKEQHRQTLQHRPSVRARKGREVPFGVRAIESGIEVDGVWISRSNTPNASAPGSPAPSIMLEPSSTKHVHAPDRASVAPYQGALDLPQPVHGHPGSHRGRNSTAPQASGPFHDPHSESERLPRSSTASDNMSRARPTYQPRRSSGLRFSNSHDNSSALAALEGRRMAPTPELSTTQGDANRTRPHRGSSSGSGSNSSEESYAPHRPVMNRDSSAILFDPTYLPSGAPRASNADPLNHLANYRRSHAAEEGQLLPRVRPNQDFGNATPKANTEHGNSTRGYMSSDDGSDPFATPVGTPIGTANYMGEPPSFASFVQSSPYPDSRAETFDDAELTSSDPHYTSNALQQGDGNRQNRQSQVVRKINSGFEILRPGSFSRPQAYGADWNEKAGGESDHYRGQRAEGSDKKRHSKRLRRKRADSKESRFKEEV